MRRNSLSMIISVHIYKHWTLLPLNQYLRSNKNLTVVLNREMPECPNNPNTNVLRLGRPRSHVPRPGMKLAIAITTPERLPEDLRLSKTFQNRLTSYLKATSFNFI